MTPTELKVARERLGLSQEQLAIALGVHRVSVVRWETGFHKVPPMLALAMKELEHEFIDREA
jgi:DNA-binding XRE family transcriptional regulator